MKSLMAAVPFAVTRPTVSGTAVKGRVPFSASTPSLPSFSTSRARCIAWESPLKKGS